MNLKNDGQVGNRSHTNLRDSRKSTKTVIADRQVNILYVKHIHLLIVDTML